MREIEGGGGVVLSDVVAENLWEEEMCLHWSVWRVAVDGTFICLPE
jgi:hypothetical protein